jgi:hypothetical protein
MTRICPLCGNPNDDTVRFCTSCGNSLVPQAGQPGMATIPLPAQVSPTAPSGQNSARRIIAIAVVAILVILAALYFLQVSGTIRIFPSSIAVVTTRGTPTVTSYVMIDTSLPETTTPILVITTDITNITQSPRASPTPTKVIVCPSDRRLCGANCTDIMTDAGNCGTCGVSCSTSQTCQQGICMAGCTYGETSCFDGCYDLSYDTQNCGTCGNTCPVGLVCNRSICAPPLTTLIPTYSG